MKRLPRALALLAGLAILGTGLLARAAEGFGDAAAAHSASRLETLKQRAAAGDAAAEFQLGELLEEGADHATPEARQRAWSEAADWYLRASEQGVAAAQNNLGAMYLDGRGVNKDPSVAESYYRRAAQHGSAEGELNLALLILRHHVPGSTDEALQWLRQSSDAGFAPAQAQLAQLYLDGVLLPPDNQAAAELFHRSAEQGYAWGEYGYAQILQSGAGVTRNLSEAARWMQQAAAANLAPALYDYAMVLEAGLGVAPDHAHAAVLLRKAAQLGEPRAKARLSKSPRTGEPPT